MKSIEERAKEWGEYIAERTPYDVVGAKYSYIAGANEQKEIDDAELLKLKMKWERDALIPHGIVMKNIQERAKEWSEYIVETTPYDIVNDKLCVFDEDRDIADVAEESYIAGARDQQAIDEEVRLKKSDDMTKAESAREEAFAGWYLKNGKGTPTYSDAIEWSRKQTTNEACELIEKALQKLTTYKDKDDFTENEFKIITVSQVPNWLINFRKSMEG